jgi:hypothetical protein
MKLRYKVNISTELELEKDCYPKGAITREILEIEKDNFPETLINLVEDSDADISVIVTLLDERGFPMGDMQFKLNTPT